MKNLLTTTAVFSVISLVSSVAMAESPLVSTSFPMGSNNLSANVGGKVEFQAPFVDQKKIYRTGSFTRNRRFVSNSRLDFNVDGKADNGLGYGAMVRLDFNIKEDRDNQRRGVVDEDYVYLNGPWGEVQLGATNDVTNTPMRVNSASFAAGDTGVDGSLTDYVNLNGYASLASPTASKPGYQTFIAYPKLYTATGTGIIDDANKINYYSPSFNGFQLGFSYTPYQGDTGPVFTSPTNYTNYPYKYADVMSGAVNYTAQYQQVGIKASLVGETGKARKKVDNMERLAAYQAGLNLSYEGFTVGGSYGSWGRSGRVKNVALDKKTRNRADFWDAGVGYEAGPINVSATYISSDYHRNKLENLVFGVDYKLVPGFVPYVDVAFFKTKEQGQPKTLRNKGTVVIAGTRLRF